MSGCDCSGNSHYIGSLSTTMNTLPTSNYDVFGGGFGSNSGAFISGTQQQLQQPQQPEQHQQQHQQHIEQPQHQQPQQISHFTNQNNSISNINPMNQPATVPQQPQTQPPLRPKNIQNVPQVEIKRHPVREAAAPAQQMMKCPNPLNKNGLLLVVLLIAGLAWHEVIRVNIVKSIKCGDGSSQYYMYYAVVATVIGAFLMFK